MNLSEESIKYIQSMRKFQEEIEVDAPHHYQQGDIECIDALASATVGKTGIEAVCVANIIKYLWRYESKGKPLQDVKKAQWYLNKLRQELENGQDPK